MRDAPTVDAEAAIYAEEFFGRNLHLKIDANKTYFNEFSVTRQSQFSLGGRLNVAGTGQWSDTHPKGSLKQSTSLADLVKNNFDDAFLDSGGVTGGDSRFGVYDSNEKDREYSPSDNKVPIPSLRENWKHMDFAGHYASKLAGFLDTHGTTIARGAMNSAREQAKALRASGKLSEQDHDIAQAGFTDPTLDPSSAAGRKVSIHTVEIGGRHSTNMLRIQDEETKRNVFYMPGEAEAVKGFGSQFEADRWLGGRTAAGAREFALRHFSNNDATGRDGSAGTSVADALGPRRTPGGRLLPPMESGPGKEITESPFKHLADATRKGFEDDAHYEITTNKDVQNRQLLRLATTSPLALVPGVPGIAQIALGKTPGDRAAGLGDLAFDAITSLVPGAAEVANGLKSLDKAMNNVAKKAAQALGDTDHFLARAFDPNVSLKGKTPNANGVYTINGKQYVSVDGNTARIQAFSENTGPILIDQEGQPLAGRGGPAYLVRDEQGGWTSNALRGGGKAKPTSSMQPVEAQQLVTDTQEITFRGGDKGYVYSGYVFRGDMRPREVIFQEGFKLRTPINDINEVNGFRGGYGGGHDALDSDGKGISTSAFYNKDGSGAFFYGGAKGGHTYLVDARKLEGHHLYQNSQWATTPQSTVQLKPWEINYGADIPSELIVGAFDADGKFWPNPARFTSRGKYISP